MIGQSIGNHKIIKLIGEGGMGTVFLAEHERLGRKVAIKMLHPHLVRDPGIRARFKNEATLLAKLQHRNIVTLYDYVEEDDALFLIMEYVEGRDLDDLVRNEYGPFPTHLLKTVFEQVLDALGYAHSQKVIHRDIKPSNFILTNDGVIKVLDFGIAKIFGDSDHNLTKTGTRMGTVFYMSPEQVRGEKPDERSDIYSLGMMLFNLATGKLPFREANSEFEIYNQIVSQDLPAPSSVYPGVSSAIERLIQVATQKDKARRFQSCDDFRKGRAPGGDPPGIAASQNVARGNSPAAAAHPHDAKTVVDMRSAQVLNSPAKPVKMEVRQGSKLFTNYARTCQPLHSFFFTFFMINLFIFFVDQSGNAYISIVFLSGTAPFILLLFGSMMISNKQKVGLPLSRVMLVISSLITIISLIYGIITYPDFYKSNLTTFEEVILNNPGVYFVFFILIGLHAIWALRAVFSKGATNYFKKS